MSRVHITRCLFFLSFSGAAGHGEALHKQLSTVLTALDHVPVCNPRCTRNYGIGGNLALSCKHGKIHPFTNSRHQLRNMAEWQSESSPPIKKRKETTLEDKQGRSGEHITVDEGLLEGVDHRGAGDGGDNIDAENQKAKEAGLCEPISSNDPIIFDLEEVLFEQWINADIYVDDTENECPSQVWYLKKGTAPEDQIYKIIEKIHENYLPHVEYMEKWEKAAQEKTNETLNICLKVFDELEQYVKYNKLHGVWGTARNLSTEISSRIEKITKGTVLDNPYLAANIASGFKNQMKNAAATRAVQNIIEMALLVVFGTDKKCANVFPMTSFPVKVAKKSGIGLDDFDIVQYDVPPSMTSSTASISQASSVSSEKPRKRRATSNEVFGDLYVASGHEPNWPRFLMVIELKSEHHLSKKLIGQLFQEMVAPVMNQSFVYGLIMNSQSAVLVTMHHDFDAKEIHVYAMRDEFADGRQNHRFVLDTFFVHICAALDYSKNKMKMVKHGF